MHVVSLEKKKIKLKFLKLIMHWITHHTSYYWYTNSSCTYLGRTGEVSTPLGNSNFLNLNTKNSPGKQIANHTPPSKFLDPRIPIHWGKSGSQSLIRLLTGPWRLTFLFLINTTQYSHHPALREQNSLVFGGMKWMSHHDNMPLLYPMQQSCEGDNLFEPSVSPVFWGFFFKRNSLNCSMEFLETL